MPSFESSQLDQFASTEEAYPSGTHLQPESLVAAPAENDQDNITQREPATNLLPYVYEIPEGSLVTPETAKNYPWFSSNTSVEEKLTSSGEKIYGLSLTTNPEYAQTYSSSKRVNVFNVAGVKLKPVSFDEGMTIGTDKLLAIIEEGYDGVLFEGMGGPEIALLKNIVTLEGQTLPIPKGVQYLIDQRRSLPVTVDEYGVSLPEGYTQEGDRYVFNAHNNSEK